MRASAVWRRANFTDRLLLIYFTALGVAIGVRHDRVAGWPSYLALHAGVIVLIAAAVWWSRRWTHAHAWYPLAVPLIAFPEAALLHDLFVGEWQDSRILGFERALFAVPPTVWLGRWSSKVVSEVLQVGYLSYFFFLPTVAAVLYSRPDRKPFVDLMAATMFGYVVCYLIFLVFPTEGPAHALRHLHTEPLPGGPLRDAVLFIQRAGTHGNAFPSAHVVAPWLLPLLILMCIGAVYDRYHYASDMIGGLLIGVMAAHVVVTVTR